MEVGVNAAAEAALARVKELAGKRAERKGWRAG